MQTRRCLFRHHRRWVTLGNNVCTEMTKCAHKKPKKRNEKNKRLCQNPLYTQFECNGEFEVCDPPSTLSTDTQTHTLTYTVQTRIADILIKSKIG